MRLSAKLPPETLEAIALVSAAPQRPLFPAIEVADTAKALAASTAKLEYLRREVALAETRLRNAKEDTRDAVRAEEDAEERLEEAQAAFAAEERNGQ